MTHDLASMPALPTKDLRNIDNVSHNYDVIGIDEGQFFNDIAHYCEKWAQTGKTVVARWTRRSSASLSTPSCSSCPWRKR